MPRTILILSMVLLFILSFVYFSYTNSAIKSTSIMPLQSVRKNMISAPPSSAESSQPVAELLSCLRDTDCVSVRADNCGCTAGGKATAINKTYSDKWDEEHPREICLTVMSGDWTCVNAASKCVNNKCALVKRN